MFTTIMYGVINEITRQPPSANISLRGRRGVARQQPVARQRPTARQGGNAARRHGQLPGKFLVLADSFKRAAGFY